MAFLLGYYGRLGLSLPAAAWQRIKKSTGIDAADDRKGMAQHRRAAYLQGLKGLLGIK